MAIHEFRAIATLAKAIELGSLRQAALAQGVTPQAASQAIAQLEQHLGVRLLHRTTRRLALTAEGLCLLENARPALASLDRALLLTREIKDEMAGPLRIVGPRSSFAPLLMPLLTEFCQAHPGIRPDVQLDDGLGNWVQDRVDVGFRIDTSPEDGVIGRRLFPVQLIVCAAPAYLARHGWPTRVDDLATHRCSVYRHPATGKVAPWYLTVDGEVEHHHLPASAFSTNDTELELGAVLAGQVIGQMANFLVADHLRAGRLVPLLLPHLSAPMGLHLYYGSRIAQPRRVRAFIDLAVARWQGGAEHVLGEDELLACAQAMASALTVSARTATRSPAAR